MLCSNARQWASTDTTAHCCGGKGQDSMAKNKIKLNICGFECGLCSNEDENYIRSIGSEVQQAINDMMESNERLSVTMAAIITALNYCDEAHKSADTADNLRTQVKNYLEDSSHARLDAEESKRELERVKHENQSLRARLATEGEPPDKSEEESPASNAAPQQITGELPAVGPEKEADPESFINFFEKSDGGQ